LKKFSSISEMSRITTLAHPHLQAVGQNSKLYFYVIGLVCGLLCLREAQQVQRDSL
jgi:hypothetical protein